MSVRSSRSVRGRGRNPSCLLCLLSQRSVVGSGKGVEPFLRQQRQGTYHICGINWHSEEETKRAFRGSKPLIEGQKWSNTRE